MCLFHNGQDIALTNDGALLAVHLDFGAGILAGQNFIANLDDHLNFLAVHKAAGANSDNFGHLGLFFGGAGQNQAALGSLFFFGEFDHNAISERFDFHGERSSYNKSLFETCSLSTLFS